LSKPNQEKIFKNDDIDFLMDKDDRKYKSVAKAKGKSVKRYDYLTKSQRSYFSPDMAERRIQ